MDEIQAALTAQEFFRGFDPRHLARIAACTSVARFAPGELLCQEGQEADRFYLITQGRVSVEVFAPGRVPFTVQTLSEGDILGWSWFSPPYRWHSDARAVTLTRALVFDAPCVRETCDADPALGVALVKQFANEVFERLQATRLQLLDVYGTH